METSHSPRDRLRTYAVVGTSPLVRGAVRAMRSRQAVLRSAFEGRLREQRRFVRDTPFDYDGNSQDS
jgi:hypothetical protein